MSSTKKIRIDVPALTRVEGEGALHLSIDNGKIETLQLEIFEPPRYFEKFLEGRPPQEVIDAVARICGICPVAYQISAAQAIEQAFDIKLTPWSEAMRRVFYCGEWIQSHALHIHMLAAPDFLGFDTVLQMSEKYPDIVRRGIQLQGVGNALISLFGARSVHPVGIRPGGFFKTPENDAVEAMIARLEEALPLAKALVQWSASLPLPDDAQDFTSAALHEPDRYAINHGKILTSSGLSFEISDYEQHFSEHHEPHSTALYSLLHNEPYLVGPLARINLNFEQLPADIQETARTTGIQFPSRNMFHSIVARAIEIHYAIFEAHQLLTAGMDAEQTDPKLEPDATTAFGCSEAPRGTLWHKYEFTAEGVVRSAKIVPPTSQNQSRIEEDLHNALTAIGLDQSADTLRRHSEMVIRNYDPCISCATHFLKLKIKR